MGQKVHPNGIRLGITKPFASTWFASNKDFAENLRGDHLVREYLKEKLKRSSLSKVVIERCLYSLCEHSCLVVELSLV